MKSPLLNILTIALILLSCEPKELSFAQAQPAQAKILDKIPTKYLGLYNNLSDTGVFRSFSMELPFDQQEIQIKANNTLEINEQFIFNHIEGNLFIDLSEISDSTDLKYYQDESIVDSLIFKNFNRSSYQYELKSTKNHLMEYNFNLTDTAFQFNTSYQLKKYKGKTYINIKTDEETWNVYQLNINGIKQLKISYIPFENEVVLRKIMEVNKEESENEILNPSKKSFKKLLKVNCFEKSYTLEKQDL